ncbi:MAG TPA: methyltransferase domain-containing protein [Candidatus Saccharimonadales bacterium]|nr:methyltransferase domain-containing protein [Candidatus Saccharimonadales bacterium]
MESPNDHTLAAYNENVLAYKKNTPQDIKSHSQRMLEWINESLSYLPPHGKVFEIGSATLRDASYIRERGFVVTCSDAAIGFVNDLRAQGEQALVLNVLKDRIPQGYDMIFANSVFHHFTDDDANRAIAQISAALEPGKIFSFCVRVGSGETWVSEKFADKRYVHFWNVDTLVPLLWKNGFEVLLTSSNIGNFPDHLWLNIIARKRS